ncbi:NAD(P)-binding protein [Venustampulla echinocandica]|uniref:NAD(P)-binding protein n=1 Tax=Venustampulla echinocandica TaxID=2656787 RepID=A0A370TU15_9HELO|nr:NAD(P)-binding protein [Venustampulla echinocandica]RDL39022.1 NAD(P)-binding protein [Venustampulla echinocandica]
MSILLKLLGNVYNNKFGLPPIPPPNTFAGKNVLITGATSGLGLAAATHYVNLGAASVIITARTQAKGLSAKETIEAQTNTKGKDIVQVRELDMSTFAGAKAFADKVRQEVKKIDIVLLNAGIYNTKFVKGNEGYEESIQVNVLSTALLALLLLPWMKEVGGGAAHLTFVTSGNHRDVQINTPKWPRENVIGYFSKEENWPTNPEMYAVSKLLEQYAVNEIAKLGIGKDGKPDVIVNPLCPGMVKSELARHLKTNIIKSTAIDLIMTVLMKTTEGGARSVLYATLTTPEEHGKYITHYQSDEDYKLAVQHNVRSPEGQKMQERVWKEVVTILEENVSEVKRIGHPL